MKMKFWAYTWDARYPEYQKKDAYKRIDASRPPICQGCGCRDFLSHSHRFPQAYQNYAYIAVDEAIDIYCMERSDYVGCHALYERNHLWKLRNGEEVMNYLMETDYQFFMAKLSKMSQRISEERKKKWLQESQGLVSIPEWATELIKTHLNDGY